MSKRDALHIRVDERLYARVERHAERMARQRKGDSPGDTINVSAAARNLILTALDYYEAEERRQSV